MGGFSGDMGGWKQRDTREEMREGGPAFLPHWAHMAGDT